MSVFRKRFEHRLYCTTLWVPTDALLEISTADSLAIEASETATQVDVLVSIGETAATQCADVILDLSVSALASESMIVGITDEFSGSQVVLTQESLACIASGDTTNTVSIAVTESLASAMSDAGELSQVTISASESLAAVADEIANVVQNTLLSVSENVITGFSESVTITYALSSVDSFSINIGDVFTGSQALGVSDDLGFLLSEDQSSSLLVAALDGVATSLSGAASVYLSQVLLDDVAIQLSEAASKQDTESAIPKTASDSCTIDIEEGALTELAGPYWTGTIWEDRGLVYADSYSMGRRDNPGRMRW